MSHKLRHNTKQFTNNLIFKFKRLTDNQPTPTRSRRNTIYSSNISKSTGRKCVNGVTH